MGARDELVELLSIWDMREPVLDSVVDHLLANPDVVLRALGGRRYGQIPHEDGWRWHVPEPSTTAAK
jgi:hypothetical protein